MQQAKDKQELDKVINILRAASKGAKKNELRHRCKMTAPLLGRYLSALTELNLLEIKRRSELYYQTTMKGLELLHTYHKLKWLLWGGTFDYVLIGLITRLRMDRREVRKYTGYIS